MLISLEFFYNCIKHYDKNLLPIKDMPNDLTQINNIGDFYNAFIFRQNIINKLNELPSTGKRNLKNDLKIPRNSVELERYDDLFGYFIANISLLNNRPKEVSDVIINKMFRNNVTLNELTDFVEEKENLIGGVRMTREDIMEIVDEYAYNCKIVFETKDAMVIELDDIEPLLKLGTNSVWCFTYGKSYKLYDQYSTNGVIYIIIDFRLPDTDSEFMFVLTKPLDFDVDEDNEEEINEEKLHNQLNNSVYNPIFTLNYILGLAEEELEELFAF